jgi:2-succinyl-5-enolpyruvyl-6-hydroxy-3-cyclohexene-1-carboxylate synthase
MKEAFWIIDQLICQGIDRFCIAPGSRNTPLVVAAVEHPKAKTIVHYDERGLGFYALGYGKGAKRPAAVITTSGTAVGNLLPSVMEAHHSSTPLLLLTTDRPAELRDSGANQTTDQIKIFDSFVRWQADLPPTLTENYFRSIAAQAVFHSMQNAPGPVQLNCQFREPLYAPHSPLESGTPIHFTPPRLVPPKTKSDAKRGAILIGETGCDPRPILNLAARLKWPVFADILSNARLHPSNEQIRHFDWILKSHPDLKPETILHFGNRFASKKILDLGPTFHISPSPFLQDPNRTLLGRLQCDIVPFCDTFSAESDPSWLPLWKKLDEKIDAISKKQFQEEFPFTEAHAMRRLAEILPENSALFLGSGMPIRDADHFLFPKKCLGFFGNRGLSGIDGNIATAAGLSDGLFAPVVAFLGDQTCLHDLNSLPLLKKTAHPVTLLASNNFGSGIFSHLPIAEWPQFETYMAAAHSWRFEDAARMFGIPYLPFERISFDESALVELFTKRDENYRFQKELLEACLKQTALL